MKTEFKFIFFKLWYFFDVSSSSLVKVDEIDSNKEGGFTSVFFSSVSPEETISISDSSLSKLSVSESNSSWDCFIWDLL